MPWIGIKDATENHGRVLTDTFQHTNELGIANSSARILPTNTVCLSRTASLGFVVVMGKPMATSQDFVNWVCSEALDHRFLKYVLLAERAAFSRFASGTTHQTIYFPEVKAFHVCLPPLPEQRAIAHILGTLDEKTELNRRMNETLEAMARALFKSWFVDFDPVRAKAEGRDPGLPEHLANLFPARLVGSELGEIPEGWGVRDIYWSSAVIYGAPFKSALFNEDGVGKPLIRIRDLATHDPDIWTPEEHPRGHLIQSGDLVVGMDGAFRAHLWCGPEAWLNQRLCCFMPKSGVPRAFVHYSIETLLEFFERSKTGTTVIHLGKRDIDTFRVLKPPQSILTAFGALLDPVDARILASASESRTLKALRDTLLPKLISGELRVMDAERIVSRAEE